MPRSVPDPGAHGGDGARVASALGLDPSDVVDLSASFNPFAPDVAALVADLTRSNPATVERYPDSRGATESLAHALGEDPDRVVLTNGAAEAIALVAGEQPVGEVVDPEFSLYRRHLASVEPGAPRWRSNPSNPLGWLAAGDDTAGVWDESFFALATGRWTRGDTDAWRIGSLTKLWACPGLRLGYVIAPDAERAQRIRGRQPRWAVNGLALAAVAPLLAATDLVGWHRAILDARSSFADELRSSGFGVTETDANWLLVESTDLRSRLAPHGVVVRDCTSFGLPDLVRVAVPTPAATDRVVGAFAAVGP